MPKASISNGVVHDVPADLRNTLMADSSALMYWEDITPLARNEWLCWVEDAKKAGTRQRRIERVRSNLNAGISLRRKWSSTWKTRYSFR